MNNHKANNAENEIENEQLEIARNEDVEFSESLADAADLEAAERAQAADERQENA
ncbi:YfhD family protein [Paenibacillus oceani]|uniref:YfhD family protein n=1 Tax=Paenibacillus oceani TaxID=2772510 RepID=A0A927H0B9_9BACL|nr:YfhD family protein [Paenibacillus oceani]MBD2863896.1 YfhD family protein [Paenibacillus oceani]